MKNLRLIAFSLLFVITAFSQIHSATARTLDASPQHVREICHATKGCNITEGTDGGFVACKSRCIACTKDCVVLAVKGRIQIGEVKLTDEPKVNTSKFKAIHLNSDSIEMGKSQGGADGTGKGQVSHMQEAKSEITREVKIQ